MKVEFKTKDGKKVSFHDSGKRAVKRQARFRKSPSAFALYVQKHIRGFLNKGMSNPQAMKAVAKKYNAGTR